MSESFDLFGRMSETTTVETYRRQFSTRKGAKARAAAHYPEEGSS